MTRTSERKQLLQNLESTFIEMIKFDEVESQEFEELMEFYLEVQARRNLCKKENVPKQDSYRSMIFQYDDVNFRQIARMDKDSFMRLLGKIVRHPVFQNNSNNQQHPVWMQLMVAVGRFGWNGTGASVGQLARLMGFGSGTVTLMTTRCIEAIFSLHDEYIFWPDAEERMEISRMFEAHGFPGAVAIVDGTPVVLSQRPHIDGEVFWTRKMIYAFNLQLLCDDRKLIRSYLMGWPGSVYDSTVFDEHLVCKHPERYFSLGQYLLADAGYTGRWYICVPFRHPAAAVPENQVFNELFSQQRCIIEHVNGILKNRFGSLKGLRTQINKKADLAYVNKWVVVLHNMMILFNDTWVDEDMKKMLRQILLLNN